MILDENKIEQCIELLTGKKPLETITGNKYNLTLGEKSPLIVGYDKNYHRLGIETMRFSARVKMLTTLCDMMRSRTEFLKWVAELE